MKEKTCESRVQAQPDLCECLTFDVLMFIASLSLFNRNATATGDVAAVDLFDLFYFIFLLPIKILMLTNELICIGQLRSDAVVSYTFAGLMSQS